VKIAKLNVTSGHHLIGREDFAVAVGKEYRIPQRAVEEVEACEARPAEVEHQPAEPARFVASKIVLLLRR